jgi:rhamnose utilization protein RhaD (predicted bifunctional aldolase and dehydrogenase)
MGDISSGKRDQLEQLKELSARIGCDPLLTQASTGNTSIKLNGTLWIKASGRWLADAELRDILVPLDLNETRSYIKRKIDPSHVYEEASVETAMHAVLPHRVVMHVHSVNTIAWAVRKDARRRLESRLRGLAWQWISYVPSGLPLATAIERVASQPSRPDVFILGNHGLVVAGDDCEAVAGLLTEVERRLAVSPRKENSVDYTVLSEVARRLAYVLPEDDIVHALATDRTSQTILSQGILFPCQSIFSNSLTPDLFRAIPLIESCEHYQRECGMRPFLIIEGCGVLVRRDMTTMQRAIMSGLAQVVQRINASAPIRYLTDEQAESSARVVSRYHREAHSVRQRLDTSVVA